VNLSIFNSKFLHHIISKEIPNIIIFKDLNKSIFLIKEKLSIHCNRQI